MTGTTAGTTGRRTARQERTQSSAHFAVAPGARIGQTQQRQPALFPSFFLGGFECSSHIDRSGERQDLLALTQHDRQYRLDYELVRSAGMHAVRDGIRWHLMDECGRYNFDSAAPRVDAAQELGIVQVWDVFHYGYPEDLDPFDESFVPRFAAFANRFARWLSRRVDGQRYYIPMNEPSFFAWAAGEVGWFAPFLRGDGWRLKQQLMRAAIAATDAIRDADPTARLLTADPVIHAVPPADEPELAEDAKRFNSFQYQAWDILVGRLEPQLGGRPEYLDVVGVNYYPHNQWEHCREGCLAYDDPRRKPFRQILLDVYQRYRRPVVVTETASKGELRPRWLQDIVTECIAAMEMGVDLQGICLYPIIDMPEWQGGYIGEYLRYGLWDLEPEGEVLRRVVYQPYLDELRRSQARIEDALRSLGARRPAASLAGAAA